MAKQRGRANKQAEEKSSPGAAPSSLPARLQAGLTIAAVALLFCSVLIPSEGAIREGTFAPLAAGWCVLGLLWAVLLIVSPVRTIRWGRLEWMGLTFVGWHTVAAIAWLGYGNDRQTLNALWLIVGYGLTAFLLRQLIASAQQARALLVVLIALAAVLSILGYEEYFLSKPALIARYEASPDEFLIENGIPTDADSPERQRFDSRLRSVEPLTTFSLTNSLAGFLVPWLIATLGIGLAAIATFRFPRADDSIEGAGNALKTLLASVVCAVAVAGCLLLTKSRTAVLACAVSAVLLLVYGRRGGWQVGWRWPAMAVALATLLGLIVVFVGGLDAEVLSEAPKSLLYRLEYWRSTAAMIADYPLFGCGPGNFQESYAAYKLPQASETVQDPHNFLLEIWATSGTPGLLLFLATVGAFVSHLIGLSRNTPRNGAAQSDDLGRWLVYGGAALGVFVAVPLAAIVGMPPIVPEWMRAIVPLPGVWIIGLPVLGLTVWLLNDWVERGDLPLAVALVALIALAINLLAAGAFVFPGVVAGALALVPIALAISGGRREPDSAPAKPIRSDIRLSTGASATAALLFLLLTIGCLLTEYQPVLNGKLKLDESLLQLRNGRVEFAEQAASAAAAADPWWAEPWLLVAEIRHQRYLQTGEQRDLQAFVEAAEQFRRHNSRHHLQSSQRGNWYLIIWRKSKDRRHLEEAMAAYRDAIAHFPAHALYHAQLAWMHHLAGDSQAARDTANRAKELDAANPHADQKLRRQHLLDPRLTDGGWALRQSETAEQSVESLRTGTSREKAP